MRELCASLQFGSQDTCCTARFGNPPSQHTHTNTIHTEPQTRAPHHKLPTPWHTRWMWTKTMPKRMNVPVGPACPDGRHSLVSHGRPWPPSLSEVLPAPTVAFHGLPWLLMASHGVPSAWSHSAPKSMTLQILGGQSMIFRDVLSKPLLFYLSLPMAADGF